MVGLAFSLLFRSRSGNWDHQVISKSFLNRLKDKVIMRSIGVDTFSVSFRGLPSDPKSG